MSSTQSGSRESSPSRDGDQNVLDPVDLTVSHDCDARHALNASADSADSESAMYRGTLASGADGEQASNVSSNVQPSHEKQEAEKKPSRWSRISDNTWTFEALTISFSLACMAAIVIVLSIYDGKALQPLPLGLTLNAIVSTLATGAETALVAVIASTLSQLKWRWFTDRRPLNQIQAFDNASRGALGSFQLLIEWTGNKVALTAAALTILALVFDPFVQQIIDYPILTTPALNGIASTRKASSFQPQLYGVDFLSAINAGIWAEASQFSRAPICTSGNCTWPDFESLGWCSKCEDVKASTSIETRLTNASSQDDGNREGILWLGSGAKTVIVKPSKTPSNGARLSTWTISEQIIWQTYSTGKQTQHTNVNNNYPAYPKKENGTILGIPGPAMAFGYAQIEITPNLVGGGPFSDWLKVVRAEQCVLTPCTRKYSIRTSPSGPNMVVLSTNYGVIVETLLNPRVHLETFPTMLTTCWQPQSGNIGYTWVRQEPVPGASTYLPIEFWANKSLSAFCPVADYVATIESYIGGSTTQLELRGPSGIETVPNLPGISSSSDMVRRVAAHNLSFVIENVAASLTALALDEVVTGAAHMSTSHVRVRWYWLIYPVVLELLGLAMFIMTVIQTRSRKTFLWRSSLYPLFFHLSVKHQANEHLAPTDVAGMEAKAEQLHAKLTSGDDGASLYVE